MQLIATFHGREKETRGTIIKQSKDDNKGKITKKKTITPEG